MAKPTIPVPNLPSKQKGHKSGKKRGNNPPAQLTETLLIVDEKGK